MIEIRETDQFQRWQERLRDTVTRAIIARRIAKLRFGHFGDAKSLGENLYELRIHYDPGYRVYFTRFGETIVLLLCAGDKGSQPRDIATARALIQDLKT